MSYFLFVSQQSCWSLNCHRPFGLVWPYQVSWLFFLRQFRWPPAGDSPRLPAHILHGSRAGPAPCGSCYTHVPWRDAVFLQRLKGTGVLQTACSTGAITHRRNISKDQRGVLCRLERLHTRAPVQPKASCSNDAQ